MKSTHFTSQENQNFLDIENSCVNGIVACLNAISMQDSFISLHRYKTTVTIIVQKFKGYKDCYLCMHAKK